VIDNESVETDTSVVSVKGDFTGESWPSLFVLWLCWSLAVILLPGQILGPAEVAGSVGIVWLGHVGAAVLSGRDRWLLYGSVAIVVPLLIALLIGFITQTPYPVSTIEWVPFAAGSGFRWEFFGVSVAVATSAAVALRPPVRLAQLARAGFVALAALSYFVLSERWLWWYHPAEGAQLITLALSLAAVGIADTAITAARARQKVDVVGAWALPFATLGVLVLFAGILWRVVLGTWTPFLGYGPMREPDNALAIRTVSGILLVWLIVSTYLIRKMLQSGQTYPSPNSRG
jgi:hypothetical protein